MSNFITKIFVASCLVLLGGGMAWAQTVAHSALFGTVLEYPTTGCDGAVVQTPAYPGALNSVGNFTDHYKQPVKVNPN